MASKNKKLALAADIFEQEIEGIIRKIAISDIQPSVDQPRTHFDDTINNLAESIKTEGLLQPIVVTKEGTHYKIIAGERRYRAARLAGLTEIECRILRKNPKDTYRLAVIENLQRENLNAVDEARAFRKLKIEYGYNDSDLSKIIGKSRNYINEILSVAEIPNTWIEKAKNLGIESKNILIQFAQAVKAGTGESFLTAFESGTVKTVASAKQFNKTQKIPSSQTTTRKATIQDIQCKGDLHNKKWRFTVEFTVSEPGSPDKVAQIEAQLAHFVKERIPKLL
ncbi:MAG TPA: ParB/RepB/Spo0J family partition protein [Turneriella sp.]|nr:ParB/RepB/Spo0J family partition protein [Turneriella sp.]